MKLRFALLFLWCSASTVACGYLLDGFPLPFQVLLLLGNFAIISLGFWWYVRSLPKRPPPPAAQPDLTHLEAERKAALERHVGKSFERLRSEASHWLRTENVHDYLVYGYAEVSPPIRAIVETEVLAGNTVTDITTEYTHGEVSRVVVTLRDPFRRETVTLPRGERFGWEHFYADPLSRHEVRAIFKQSSAESPLLCEHLRDVEIALHRAEIPLIVQFGNSRGRWLRFHCDLELQLTRARYGLSEFILAYEEEHQEGADSYKERRLYCSLCGCGIEEAGGLQKFPLSTRVTA